MKNMFIFALISATLFACTPIENEPQVTNFGFSYGETYTVDIYEEDNDPYQESIVFVNDSVAVGDGATFTSTWNKLGVLLQYESEEFKFIYNSSFDKLVCNKTDQLTITIRKY